MDTPPVIDMWAPVVPTPAIALYAAEHFPDRMLNYLRIFWKRAPTQEEVRAAMRAFERPEEEVLRSLDTAGIRQALITGFDERGSVGDTFMTNELVADLAGRYPDRFIPFAGIDVTKGATGALELAYWVRERGFRGLSLRPFMTGIPASDRRNYALYAACEELGVPLSIHTSANWSTEAINDLGHPRHIDRIAVDFPHLRIIMSHGGYPWVLEAMLLAWKYPHVYVELAAHRPRYFAEPGTGWEPLLRFGQSTVADKILYGTGMFLIGRAPADLVNEFRMLPVKLPVMEKWLYKNAAALLGIHGQDVT